ncbi:MAG TPA: hypothetical protein VLJ44_06780 [Gaiellaceae bacterium]|nr:hypothetical protein [Gaiellaceae bacterium]
MRLRLVIVPLAALAAALLARRRRRRRAATTPLTQSGTMPPLAPAEFADPGGPAASGERFVSVPWTLVEASAGEPHVTIRYCDDEHMKLDRIDAQETPTQVFVTVLTHWLPPAGGWFALKREHEAIVPLSGPLGERELVHAAVDLDSPGSPPGGGEPSEPPLYP